MYKRVLLRRMQSAEAKAARRIAPYMLQKRQAARTRVRAVLYDGILPVCSISCHIFNHIASICMCYALHIF